MFKKHKEYCMCLILLYFSAISWQMLQYLSHISSKGHSHSSASENETPLFSPFNVWLESSLIAKPLGRPAARSWVRQMWRWGVAPLQGGKEFIGKLQRMIQKRHTAATAAAVSSFCSSQHVEWGGSPLSVREGGGVGLGRRMGGGDAWEEMAQEVSGTARVCATMPSSCFTCSRRAYASEQEHIHTRQTVCMMTHH